MNVTPLFRQYLQLKEKVKDAILLFRVGDFYETYFEDAKIFSEINSVVLTKRTLPDGKTIPMAGVPFHSVDNYIRNLLNSGYKVAIAEQLESAQEAKGNLVKRDIVEIITPGTITSYNYLNEKEYNFLAIVDYKNSSFYVMAVDVSILEGYIVITKNLQNTIDYFNPSEIIFTDKVNESIRKTFLNYVVFNQQKCNYQELQKYLVDQNSYFLLEKNEFIEIFGLLINYLEKNMILSNSISVKFRFKLFSDDFILLDSSTLRNLDIVGSKNSLAEVLNYTSTYFGYRKFRVFVSQPLKNIDQINHRLDAIEFFVNNTDIIINLKEKLKRLPDIERILSKLSLYRQNFKDLITIKNFFINFQEFIEEIKNLETIPLKKSIQKIFYNFNKLDDLKNLLYFSIEDEIKNLNHLDIVLKSGFNKELDQYLYILENNEKWLRDYESKLRLETGIKSLKISYNQVFGYYIEVSKPNLSLVPNYFERKQTLVNAERFTTNELKDFESKLEQAVDKIKQIQQEIINTIVYTINQNSLYLSELLDSIAFLDIILSLAYCAVVNNYVRPKIVKDKVLILKDARHPIYEKYFEKFVPNDIYLDKEKFFMILTGPNMGGKSTFLKTVALNVLLSHIGSFVPCTEAYIGLVDGIYTRIGFSDDIMKNRSTFMVEMLETAYILDNCTENSFVIIDELGRGTSTYDGMAIAWAVCQYLAQKVKCRTILSSHFHQLSNLEKVIDYIVNYNVKVLESNGDIEFTYKVVKGSAEKSYGLFVAKIANIKPEVLQLAQQVLDNFEKLTGLKKVQSKLILNKK